MSDNANTPPIQPSSRSAAESVLSVIKDWWELILSIATTIGAALAAFGLDGATIKITSLALAIVAVGACAFFWRQGRQRDEIRRRQKDALATWRDRKPGSAFRGLLSYGKLDTLPGENRRREAFAITTQVVHPDFTFGILSGDVGCGKTSLLQSGLHVLLENQGYRVVLIRSPRQLEEPRSTGMGPVDKLRQTLCVLRQRCREASTEGPAVLIIDQFEELLIEYPGADDRQELGAFLREPIPGQQVKVLCAVRYDYLLDMHDLAPALPEPLSTKSLFRLRNLTEEEAKNVIAECARQDGFVLEAEFAELLAADLSQGGMVRPPELQLVCTALTGDMTVRHYREAGGTRGILSDYVRSAIELCSYPHLGRLLLRALCDFETSPPAKKRPQTEAELVVTLGSHLGDGPLRAQLVRLLSQFEEARLIVSLRHDDTLVYSLVHDYLVGPVGVATSEVVTRTEEADQLLKLYLGGIDSDPKGTIPFRKLRFITANASATLLAGGRARNLIRRSRIAHTVSLGSLVALVLLGTSVAYVASNTYVTWERSVVGRHFPQGVEDSGVTYRAIDDGRKIWGGTFWGDPYIKLWDTRSAKVIFSDEVIDSIISREGKFVVVARKGKPTLEVIQVLTGQKFSTPFIFKGEIADDIDGITFDESGKFLISYQDQERPASREPGVDPLAEVRVWSIFDERELGFLSGVRFRNRGGATYFFRLSRSGDRLVMLCMHGERRVPALWRISPQSSPDQLVYLVQDPQKDVSYDHVSVNDRASLIATAEIGADGRPIMSLWDLKSGELLRSRDVQRAKGAKSYKIFLFSSGEHVFLQTYSTRKELEGEGGVVYTFTTADLLPVEQIPLAGAQKVIRRPNGEVLYLAWLEGSKGSRFWDIRGERFFSIPQFNIQSSRDLILQRDARHLIVRRKIGGVELWDLQAASKLKDFSLKGPRPAVWLTIEEKAVVVVTEGGVYSFYDAVTGDWINTITDVGIGESAAFYDADCRREHFWTQEGLVLRYTRGLHAPILGFRPSRQCSEAKSTP